MSSPCCIDDVILSSCCLRSDWLSFCVYYGSMVFIFPKRGCWSRDWLCALWLVHSSGVWLTCSVTDVWFMTHLWKFSCFQTKLWTVCLDWNVLLILYFILFYYYLIPKDFQNYLQLFCINVFYIINYTDWKNFGHFYAYFNIFCLLFIFNFSFFQLIFLPPFCFISFCNIQLIMYLCFISIYSYFSLFLFLFFILFFKIS